MLDGLAGIVPGENASVQQQPFARRAPATERFCSAIEHLDGINVGTRNQKPVHAAANLEKLAHAALPCSSASRSAGTCNPDTDASRASSNIPSGSSTRTMRSKPMLVMPP